MRVGRKGRVGTRVVIFGAISAAVVAGLATFGPTILRLTEITWN